MSAPPEGWSSGFDAVAVEEMSHRGAFRALAPAWEALARRTGHAGPFFHPYWFAVYAAGEGRGGIEAEHGLRLLVAHRRGALAGVLPLVAERRRVAGVPARVLRALADDHSQRFDVLAEDDEAMRAMIRHLLADPGWDVLELRDLPPGSMGERLAELARRMGCPTGVYPSLRSPYLSLPADLKALDAALDAKFRANLRRRARRLAEAAGAVTLERVTGGPDLDAALDEGFALEAAGWKGEAGTAITQSPALARRYRALAHMLAARGELSLHFLRAGERRVAFHFAVETGGVYYLFKPGYDEALARFGLGHLLLHEVARALVSRGAREIDFLGDDMPWKREWTGQVRMHAFRYVLRPTRFGRALAAWKFTAAPIARAAFELARSRLRPAPAEAGKSANSEGDAP